MDRLEKTKRLRMSQADPKKDIALINQQSLKELSPEDVYCYNVNLCDNDVDRDLERFTDATLEALAPMFIGKSGITDHYWSAEKQHSRIYRTEVVTGDGQNMLGEPLKQLRASAYMLKNEQNQPLIDAIEGGIIKEVSVGCQIGKCVCSLCGEPLRFDWRMGRTVCANDHIKGTAYEDGTCYGNLIDPTDAYEYSFVAVPSQRKAGVTKSAGDDLDSAFDCLMEADLSNHSAQIRELMPRMQMALTTSEERAKRDAIRKYAEENF